MLQAFFEDAGYRKTFVTEVKSILDLKVDISPKIKAVGNSRRLNKDLEKTVTSQEAIIKISHIHTLLKRL